MTENQENLNTVDNETQKSKKFVFQLYSDNIDFVENLTYQEKNDLANHLFNDYRIGSAVKQKVDKSISMTKKTIAIFLALIFGIPLIIYLTSLSLHFTKSSYVEMQNNFQKLY